MEEKTEILFGENSVIAPKVQESADVTRDNGTDEVGAGAALKKPAFDKEREYIAPPQINIEQGLSKLSHEDSPEKTTMLFNGAVDYNRAAGADTYEHKPNEIKYRQNVLDESRAKFAMYSNAKKGVLTPVKITLIVLIAFIFIGAAVLVFV